MQTKQQLSIKTMSMKAYNKVIARVEQAIIEVSVEDEY